MATREIITIGFGSFGSINFLTLFGFGGPFPMVEETTETVGSTSMDPKVLALTAHSSSQQRVYTAKSRYVTGDAFDEIRE